MNEIKIITGCSKIATGVWTYKAISLQNFVRTDTLFLLQFRLKIESQWNKQSM